MKVAVRACDDLYIKSTVQATGQTTNQLRRKPGVKPMAFEMMELTVETLDGQRIPGATYSWTVPAGVKVDVSSSKPHLIQADQVGEYKVTVSFGQGETCELKTELSGRPYQVFTDGNCNTAPVKIDTTAEPNANIPNLAVGDVFNTGDYEVTVTRLTSGSQTLGWTGEGMVEQNLIAGVKIPMSVVFSNIKINSCYQYYNRGENGAVVRSKTDASWVQPDPLDTENVSISENQGKSLLTNYVKIKDILRLFDCSVAQKADLKRLIAEQDALATRAQQNTDYNADQKSLILANEKELREKLEALLNCCKPVSNARMNVASCVPPESLVDLIETKEGFLASLPESTFKPYMIAKSFHRPTLNHAGTAIHQDMLTTPYTNDMFLDLGGLYLIDLAYSKETLLNDIKMYSDLSTSDLLMENVLRKMFDKFYQNRSINTFFEDPILTQKALIDKSTTTFLNRIKESLEFELNKDENFIKERKILRLVVSRGNGIGKVYNTDLPTDENPFYVFDENGKTDIKRDDFPSPVYSDLATGFKTAINDMWGYDIQLISCILNRANKTYKVELEVMIFDHFGIDPTDAREYNLAPQIR